MSLGEKAPEIQKVVDRVAQLLGGVDRGTAEALEICQLCRQPITGFRDDLSRREYQISRMCQACMDQAFDEEEDDK
jgi:hypothetical protein